MKKTILYIDDMKTNLFTIRSIIEDLADDKYDFIIALSAYEGLEILLKRKVDIILLDVMMPEVDGFECAKTIKSNEKTKKIPIIFVTANKDDETIEKCYKVGCDDYIKKPFNHTELLARIKFHLNSAEQDRLIMQEKEYVQSILDLQENLILVTNAEKILNTNKALLNFYGLDNIEEFQEKYECVCHTFLIEEGYFSLDLVPNNDEWVSEVIERSKDEDVLVKIAQEDKEHIFNVKATTFLDQYIVTLTDITQISKLSLEYKHEACFDSLTQVYNRNMFNRLMDIKMTQSKENGNPLVFIILDIDFFKNVNDIHGHLVGDNVLKHISSLIQSHTRENDLFARWGGEEFVLAFNVTIEKGFEIANNLRVYIQEEHFETVGTITCSFGITEFKIDDNLDSLLLRADEALYCAKENGRNQVCQA